MDGECDLKPRSCPPATASLPLPTLMSSKIVIDAPRAPPLLSNPLPPLFVLELTRRILLTIAPPAAPSGNVQSFDATIEVNNVPHVLSKSNILLQGIAHFL